MDTKTDCLRKEVTILKDVYYDNFLWQLEEYECAKKNYIVEQKIQKAVMDAIDATKRAMIGFIGLIEKSPLGGAYSEQRIALREIFSEFSATYHRIRTEKNFLENKNISAQEIDEDGFIASARQLYDQIKIPEIEEATLETLYKVDSDLCQVNQLYMDVVERTKTCSSYLYMELKEENDRLWSIVEYIHKYLRQATILKAGFMTESDVRADVGLLNMVMDLLGVSCVEGEKLVG